MWKLSPRNKHPGEIRSVVSSGRGFTLIELLLASVIIGILATIAIPNFGTYRARAFNIRAQSDLRHVATAQEDHFIEGNEYLSCTDHGCDAPTLSGFFLSDGVELEVVADNPNQKFTASASHHQGDRLFTYDSDA